MLLKLLVQQNQPEAAIMGSTSKLKFSGCRRACFLWDKSCTWHYCWDFYQRTIHTRTEGLYSYTGWRAKKKKSLWGAKKSHLYDHKWVYGQNSQEIQTHQVEIFHCIMSQKKITRRRSRRPHTIPSAAPPCYQTQGTPKLSAQLFAKETRCKQWKNIPPKFDVWVLGVPWKQEGKEGRVVQCGALK